MKSKINNLLLNNKRNIILLLSFLALITFGSSLFNGFTFDDTPFVVENTLIKSISNLPKIWTTNFNYGYKDANMGLYRPTINTLYTLCYLIDKDNPLFFHLLNIIFHVICSYLLFLLITYIFKNNLLAIIASLLFLLTPIHSEAVNGISRLSESVSTCFFLLAFITFIKYLRFAKKRFKYSILLLIFMFLALTSKESSITIILIFMIYDFFSEEKMALSKRFKHLISHYLLYIFIFTVYGLYLLIKSYVVGTIANSETLIWDFMENPFFDYNFVERLLTSLSQITIYIYKMLIPISLSCDYSYNNLEVVTSVLSLFFIFSLIIILTSIYLIKNYYSKDINIIIFILFFWSTYIVISNLIVLIGTNFAERLIYLPSVAFYTLIGYWIVKLIERYNKTKKHIQKLIYIVLCLIFICFIIINNINNLNWYNDKTLFKSNIDTVSNVARIYHNIAGKYTEDAKDKVLNDEAVKYVKIALQIYPNYLDGYKTLSIAYKNLEKTDLEHYALNLLIKLDEQTGKDSSNLRKLTSINSAFTTQAEHFLRKKDFDNAELWVKKGLSRISMYSNEEYVKEYFNDKLRFKDLLNTLLKYKLFDKEQQFFRELLNNNDPVATLKSSPESMNTFNQILIRLPNITNFNKLFAPYHRLIGTIHLRKEETGRYNQIRDFLVQDAVLNLEKASIEDPDYLDGLSNLGVAYNKVGKLNEAVGIFERAISIKPDNKIFYINLAAVYLENNKKNEAINSLMRYYKINPQDSEIVGMLQSLGVK